MKSAYVVMGAIVISVTLIATGCRESPEPSGPVVAQNAVVGDPVAGKELFAQICHWCHYAVPGKNYLAPSLFGVVGRHVGREPGYHYSKADLGSDVVFDEKTLDRYIESPRGTIPGTAMMYNGLKDPKKRADVIAYLATLH